MTTFLLLHGSFHAAWNWHKLIPALQTLGHDALALDLPRHGRNRASLRQSTFDAAVERVVAEVDAIGEDVVLVAHSRNGVVISQAAERRPDRIRGLVYLAAYLVPNGKSMMDYAVLDPESLVVRNVEPPFDEREVQRLLRWTKVPLVRFVLAWIAPSEHALAPAAYEAALYHDCPEDIVALASTLLEPEPSWPGFAPLALSDARYGRVPKVYVECTEDRAVTLPLQRRMCQDSPCDQVFSLRSSHSPFFSQPEALAAILGDSLGVFARAS